MNTKFIAAAIVTMATISATSAFAQTHQYGEAALVVPPVSSSSNVTRAQVQADYLKARQNGAIPANSEGTFSPVASAASNVSRAEVFAEATKWVALDGSGSKTQH